MKYRLLGKTGVMVSTICLGAMNFGGPTSKEDAGLIINRAIDQGINFIDTANSYQKGESEKIVGEVLKRGGHRGNIILATKFFNKAGEGINDRGASRWHIIQACEDSLKRLGTDYIDLYQVHRPDFQTDMDDTLRALDDLVSSGKVRYIGTSNFPAWFIMEGLAVSDRRNFVSFVSEQAPYNLLDRRIENDRVPFCLKHGISINPWSPLAGGILAGRYSAVDDRPNDSKATRSNKKFEYRITRRALNVVEKLKILAKDRGLTLPQLALLWVKEQAGITSPVIGPRVMAHLDAALKIVDRALSEEGQETINGLVPPGNVVSDFHNSSNWMYPIRFD